MYVCMYVCMCVNVCKQTFMQDIILCALLRASQHQVTATYSNKHHVASRKLGDFRLTPKLICTHTLSHLKLQYTK